MDVPSVNQFVSDELLEELNKEHNVEEHPEEVGALLFSVMKHVFSNHGAQFLAAKLSEKVVKDRITLYFAL